MRDVTVRTRAMFWAFVLLVSGLVAIPSVVLLETLRDYWRFLTGWNPGTIHRTSTDLLPHRDPGKLPDIRIVEFSLKAPQARSVRLAGSFNQWKADLSLERRPGGLWRTKVALPPGTYTYAFEVDGVWTLDPEAAHTVSLAGRKAAVRDVP